MADKVSSIYDLSYNTPSGEKKSLKDLQGKAILVVNTATQCGLAPQFAGLESLHNTYKDDGLVVLGFPCNQFMGQEPVSDEEMVEACQINHGVTFPLTEKVDVNGNDAHPVFKYLKKQLGGMLTNSIKWNFTKFLIDKDGNPVKRYSPTTEPKDLEKDIKKAL
jgi:glutathione peroxidase